MDRGRYELVVSPPNTQMLALNRCANQKGLLLPRSFASAEHAVNMLLCEADVKMRLLFQIPPVGRRMPLAQQLTKPRMLPLTYLLLTSFPSLLRATAPAMK